MTDRIDEIKALRSAAQVIAWKTRPSARAGNHYILELGCDESPIATVIGEHNAALIAAAPELLGWAVAEVERERLARTDLVVALRTWLSGATNPEHQRALDLALEKAEALGLYATVVCDSPALVGRVATKDPTP